MSAAVQQKPQFSLKLTVAKGPHAGQVFQIHKEKVLLGRGPENDVILMNDSQVSRLHAQIVLVNRDVEIIKISQKNAVLVDGANVERWKLSSGASFIIGETEIKVEFDLGLLPPPPQPLTPSAPLRLVPAIGTIPTSTANSAAASTTAPTLAYAAPPPATPQRPSAPLARPTGSSIPTRPALTAGPPGVGSGVSAAPLGYRPMAASASGAGSMSMSGKRKSTSILDNPKARFYLIAITVILGAVLVLTREEVKSRKSERQKATLKYEDEVAIELKSKPEIKKAEAREQKKLDQNSAQYLRIQENLMRGLREFGLGNYARAQEHFQIVLNLDPANGLAIRYQMLSRTRFDEVVKSKLLLGESYFTKHNFDMCASMYRQVMNMLDEKRTNPNYQLAEKKTQECQLASEGIR